MRIDPKDVKVGDRVVPVATVKRVFPTRGSVVVKFDGGDRYRHLTAEELAHAEITRPPRPLEVGDLVRTRAGAVGVIVDLHRDVAWIEPEPGKVWPLTPDDRSPLWVHISCLTRAEEKTA